MDQNTLLILLTIFVALAALAMIIQAGTLIGLFLVARKLQQKVMPMIPEVEKVVGIARVTAERVEKHVEKIGVTSNAILDVTKQQVVKIDALLNDATSRAKVQMDRAEMVLDDSMTRVTQTVTMVQTGVIRPIREVQGIVSGIRAGLAYLGKRGRMTVDHATSEEEMFI
jgi:hypothetical protein